MKRDKQLEEMAAKILRGEHALNEAQADVSKVLKVGKSLGGKVYGNKIDFGQGAVIKVSASGNKIKFDGGLSSGKEEFDSVEDAIAALKKGSDKYESTELEEEANGRLTLPPKIKEFLFANFEDQSEMDLWGFEAKGRPKVKMGASFPSYIRGDIVKRITIFPDGEVRFYGQASNDTYEGSIDDILKLKIGR